MKEVNLLNNVPSVLDFAEDAATILRKENSPSTHIHGVISALVINSCEMHEETTQPGPDAHSVTKSIGEHIIYYRARSSTKCVYSNLYVTFRPVLSLVQKSFDHKSAIAPYSYSN